MNCPNCGSNQIFVTDTVHVEEEDSIYRKRHCANCGKDFYTAEYVVDENYGEFKRIWNKNYRLSCSRGKKREEAKKKKARRQNLQAE